MPVDPTRLRALASWYREFAERAGNPVIWEARLRTAEDLEKEAGLVEQRQLLANAEGIVPATVCQTFRKSNER